jgi:hypothetical protein
VVGDRIDELHAMPDGALPPFAGHNVLVNISDPEEARALVVALEEARVESSRISYLAFTAHTEGATDGPQPETAEEAAGGESGEATLTNEERIHTDSGVVRSVGAGAGKGAATGAVGGALLGAGLMLIPGVGTLAGAGILAAALGGALGGSNLGLVWGAFRRMGVSPAWEHTFTAVESGSVVVGVHTDDDAEWARALAHLPTEGRHYFDHAGHPVTGPSGPDR